MTFHQLLLTASLAASLAEGLNNGFGRTPVMGFNTYNAAACTINQTYVRDAINDFSNMGFQSLGYNLFGLDCGWQGRQRQSNGSITYDSSVFPDGIKPLSDLAISKGFASRSVSLLEIKKLTGSISNGPCTLIKESLHATLQARSGPGLWAMSVKMRFS